VVRFEPAVSASHRIGTVQQTSTGATRVPSCKVALPTRALSLRRRTSSRSAAEITHHHSANTQCSSHSQSQAVKGGCQKVTSNGYRLSDKAMPCFHWSWLAFCCLQLQLLAARAVQKNSLCIDSLQWRPCLVLRGGGAGEMFSGGGGATGLQGGSCSNGLMLWLGASVCTVLHGLGCWNVRWYGSPCPYPLKESESV
jgi:hypothetical protein